MIYVEAAADFHLVRCSCHKQLFTDSRITFALVILRIKNEIACGMLKQRLVSNVAKPTILTLPTLLTQCSALNHRRNPLLVSNSVKMINPTKSFLSSPTLRLSSELIFTMMIMRTANLSGARITMVETDILRIGKIRFQLWHRVLCTLSKHVPERRQKRSSR